MIIPKYFWTVKTAEKRLQMGKKCRVSVILAKKGTLKTNSHIRTFSGNKFPHQNIFCFLEF